MPPVVTPEDVSTRVVNLLELLAKALIALGAVWAFIEKIIKPYSTWRRERLAHLIKQVLSVELDKLDALIEAESTCAGRMERVLRRQEEIFDANDLFLEIAADNKERHDETTELLNRVFGIDERVDLVRREEINAMLHNLRERRHTRRRSIDALPTGIPALPNPPEKKP